jgi:acetyl esterase/lipase
MKTYRIPDEMIHPELRESGKWIRRFLPYFKPSTFRKANRILKLMKGRSGKDLRYEEVWIPREGAPECGRHNQDWIPRDEGQPEGVRHEQDWIPRDEGRPEGVHNRQDQLPEAGSLEGVRYEQDQLTEAGSPKASKLRLCVYRSPVFSGDAPGMTSTASVSAAGTASEPVPGAASTFDAGATSAPVSGAPGLLWMHGGGYGLGIPEVDEGAFREFIRVTGCVIVAPDYRLSVEAPYPAALEDGYTALLWLKEHAASLGVRENQLMVGGFSAGGGLAAALAIYARDKGEVSIAFQMPIYPMLDDRMITASSRDNDAPVWNTRSNETGWRLYLGSLYGTQEVPAYAAPARLSNHRGLPPSFTFVGSIEPFRDETVDYMERLKEAGVPVTYKVFDGCFHAFDIVAKKSAPVIEAKKLMTERLRYAAEHYFAEQPWE